MKKEKKEINSFEELPIVLTVNHISSIMGISRVGAYELVKSDRFPVIRVGRRITIPKTSFMKWLEFEANRKV